jgi:hypothetical protein
MFIELTTLCIIFDSYIFLFYFSNNIFFFLQMFLQAFENDLLELPASLVENISLIPGLLKECNSSNTVQNYYYVFLRWQIWALSNGIPSEFILPAKPIRVALYLACLVQQSSSPSPINQAFIA